MPNECKCSVNSETLLMSNNGCEIHTHDTYKCDLCNCVNYVPSRWFDPSVAKFWPRCKCKHVAEEHN